MKKWSPVLLTHLLDTSRIGWGGRRAVRRDWLYKEIRSWGFMFSLSSRAPRELGNCLWKEMT